MTPKHIKDKKLIKHYVVGTCESCNGIYIKDRTGVNYLSERDIPSNIGKQSKENHNRTYSSSIYWNYYCCFHVHYVDPFIFSWVETKRKRENEDMYGQQQVNLENDALSTNLNSRDIDVASSTPVKFFLYLWDFELLPEGQNARLF